MPIVAPATVHLSRPPPIRTPQIPHAVCYSAPCADQVPAFAFIFRFWRVSAKAFAFKVATRERSDGTNVRYDRSNCSDQLHRARQAGSSRTNLGPAEQRAGSRAKRLNSARGTACRAAATPK